MKMKPIMPAALLILLLCLPVLSSCRKAVETPAAEGYWQECIYLASESSQPLVLLKTEDGQETPCTLSGLSDEDRKKLDGFQTGTVIRVLIDSVEESYPEKAVVREMEFVSVGRPEDVDETLVRQLRGMGYLIIMKGSATGLPEYEFTISWGQEGESSYDSKSGKLVRTEGSEGVLTLNDAERRKIWTILTGMDYAKYPADYDPDPETESDPPEVIELSVTTGGETASIRCADAAVRPETQEKDAEDFLNGIRQITDLIESTDAWMALSDAKEEGN